MTTGTTVAAAEAFELTLAPFGAPLRVVSFQGKERLSKSYSFDVLVVTPDGLDLLEPSVLGVGAALTIHVAGGPARVVTGVVAAIAPDTASVHLGGHAYRVRVVPKLWLLKKRIRSRIFQNVTVPEVVQAVLDAAQVPCRLDLGRAYAKREYCVQYRETDHAFVKRLLAEEGIFFLFEPPSGDVDLLDAAGAHDALRRLIGAGETVVFLDSAPGYPAMAGESAASSPELVLRHGGLGAIGGDEVLSFRLRSTLRSESLLLRDYDFTRPQLDLRESAATTADAGAANPQGVALEVYEHRGEYGAPEVDASRAQVILEQYRSDQTVGEGTSTCRRLAPGRRFTLVSELFASLAREYVPVEVEHRGVTPEHADRSAGRERRLVYENRFRCVPASVAYRSKRPAPVQRQVVESARVVGPPGEEIFTDVYGRIRVQFPWDLDGKDDGESSCWIRVVQTWAGASWGTQFIPRVGMEVLVGFLSGDPDCPVVLGCLNNATHPPSFTLPAMRTRSGIRTQSSPGGAGSNELYFEDAKSEEQIFLRAQRDFDEVVERNHSRWVKSDEDIHVEGMQAVRVDGNRTETVLGSATRAVTKDEATRVDGNRTDAVAGNADLRVTGDLVTRVGREVREVSGRSDVVLGDDCTVRSKGCYTTIVGRNDAKRSYVLRVEGTGQISTSGTLELDAEKSVTLRCGKSFIKIGPEKIELVAPAVSATGTDGALGIADGDVQIRGKGKALLKFEELIVKTSDASLSLKKDVQIDGKKILLNSPDSVTDPVEDDSPPPTGIQMKDKTGAPLAYQRFLIKTSDGSEYSGILDKDGKTEMTFEGSGEITFPDLAKP